MKPWNNLLDTLSTEAKCHNAYADLFRQFAKFITEANTSLGRPPLPKFDAHWIPEKENIITVVFAGRTLIFEFSSTRAEGEPLRGNVTCYLKKELPKPEHLVIGMFTFDKQGQTNLVEDETSEMMYVCTEFDARYILYNFIDESLSK